MPMALVRVRSIDVGRDLASAARLTTCELDRHGLRDAIHHCKIYLSRSALASAAATVRSVWWGGRSSRILNQEQLS